MTLPELLARGHAARDAGDHAAALGWFEDAATLDPAHLDARAEVGFSLLTLQRAADAQRVFLAVLATAPLHPLALAGMAQAARARGERHAARDWAAASVAVAPGQIGLRLDLAYDLLALKRFAEADVLFQSLGDDVRATIGRGQVARARGDRAAALAHFRAAVRDAPDNFDARLELAAELAESGANEGAAALLDALLAAAPERPRARLARGHLARRLGEHAAALAHFSRAADADPAFHAARVAAAETLVALGRPGEAERLFRGVLAAAPDDLGALLGLSELAWLAQDFSACLGLARQAMQARPDAPEAVLQATRALLELGETEAALAILRPFGAARGWTGALRAREGEILRRAGRWEEARAALDAATDEDFSVFVQRVLLHLTSHELDAAARLLETPRGPTRFARAYAHHLRGQVAEARWRLEDAAEHYRAAIAEDPTLAWPHAELARVALLQCDLPACERHQTAALRLDASPHLLRRQPLNATSTHVGQIWDEFRADPALGARVAACLALDPAPRAGAFIGLLREEPDTLAPSLLLLIALRQSGRLDRLRPAPDAAIPRRIVQFWADDLPQDVAALMESWPRLHPDWEYCRFDLAGAGEWLSAHATRDVVAAYVRAGLAAQKADIFRLAYLAAAGGVWADADDRALAPLDTLIAPGVRLAGWQEQFGSLGNNLLGAVPGHPVLARALGLAVAAVNRGDSDIPWLSTGPGALSRALAQEIAEDGATLEGLRVLERGEAARLAVFHCFAAYKRTAQHWLRAAFAPADAARSGGLRNAPAPA